MRGEMKFSKKSQTYVSSNVEFDPSSFVGISFKWWHFVQLINGKVVFNNYNHSPTTQRHQRKMRDLLERLGIKIDLMVETRTSLNNSNALIDAISLLELEIRELEEKLETPRRKKALDEERKASIEAKREHIKQIRIVMTGAKLKAALL